MRGRFEHSLDDKGRVIIPQKFREPLGEEFILTIGPDHHIRAYPMGYWERMEALIDDPDPRHELNKEMGFLQRMLGHSEEASLDQQNRLSIPRHLREWAELREGSAAVILGCGNRLELWSREKWSEYSKEFTEEKVTEVVSNVTYRLQPAA
jgi:MraZ protein